MKDGMVHSEVISFIPTCHLDDNILIGFIANRPGIRWQQLKLSIKTSSWIFHTFHEPL